MTSTIQFWMDVMLHNILLKIDKQYNPILNYYAKNILPKMDDKYNPILDESYTKK